jgi:hypothetical protein
VIARASAVEIDVRAAPGFPIIMDVLPRGFSFDFVRLADKYPLCGQD